MDLFAAAAENAPSLEIAFEQALLGRADEETAPLTAFLQRVEREGRVSVNAREGDLLAFLTAGKYKNIHQLAREESRRLGRGPDEILADRLGPYYERRTRFDRHFERGKEFQYGALNIGGLGYSGLGNYCMIVKQSNWARGAKMAYLKSDSLEREEYWLPDGSLNESEIKGDLAPHSHRHFLAAIKHAKDLPGRGPDQWGSMLCSDEGYVEAIFLQRLVPRGLEEVRMAKSEYDRMREDSVDALRQKARVSQLDAIDKFVRIEKELRKAGVDLRVVEDA